MLMQLDYQFHKNCFDLWLAVNSVSWRILKNHLNSLEFRLFGESTEQMLSNFELW